MDKSGSFHEDRLSLAPSPCEWREIMKEWLKPEITESEAGMEVTSYLPAELDRA
jgi:coenzyme PQQ precursor peptide PqqA